MTEPAGGGTAPLLPPAPILSVRRLSRRFGSGCPRCVEATGEAVGTNRCRWCGTVVAVHAISFAVGPGEVLGVVGESGSGKTTLLRCLHLDLVPDDGEVVVAGEEDLLRSSRSRLELQSSVVLARALVEPPLVLLVDEPATSLDPSVQANLLEVLQRVADKIAGATIVVSHDLAIVRLLASRLLVLHHGRVVEEGVTEQVLEDPQHPYTQLLVSSRLA